VAKPTEEIKESTKSRVFGDQTEIIRPSIRLKSSIPKPIGIASRILIRIGAFPLDKTAVPNSNLENINPIRDDRPSS
jgi:hypothetical protein